MNKTKEQMEGTRDKNAWIKEVSRLNPDLFAENEDKWKRYFELKKLGVKMRFPNPTAKFGRKQTKQKSDKQLMKELGSIEFHRRKKLGLL